MTFKEFKTHIDLVKGQSHKIEDNDVRELLATIVDLVVTHMSAIPEVQERAIDLILDYCFDEDTLSLKEVYERIMYNG